MFGRRRRSWFGFSRRRTQTKEITFDEILLDSSNLPSFDHERFEGRVEMPIPRETVIAVGVAFILIASVILGKTFMLQVANGAEYAALSENNRLSHSIIFAERGVVYDRTGTELAWNESSTTTSYALRRYAEMPGLSHLLGYVQYPKADAGGAWWRTEFTGAAGVEQVFDERLAGANGRALIEVDALGERQNREMQVPSSPGKAVTVSIDAAVQSKLYEQLYAHIDQHGFVGAASVIMDIHTGEILAMASVPEYSSQVLSNGERSEIASFSLDERKPFLNRAISGLYSPGSIVKPLFAAAALAEGIISPDKKIFSPGFITIPNPYNPSNPTIMKDWRAHGWTDMRQAIAVSSDVYFYAIGGGYEDQKGLGITKIDAYSREFGLGETSDIALTGEAAGLIPTPEWKSRVFDGDDWRLGDTYNTSIGQYGFQVTPLQMARAFAAIANGGTLLEPRIIPGEALVERQLSIAPEYLEIVREGMKKAVEPGGTAQAVYLPQLPMGGKTGTAEVGAQKQFMNSWVVGFWPYENPQYAYATVLERAPAGTLAGAAPAMRPFFEWLIREKPEYTKQLTE
jgi:penicillin-binding protein 2